MGNNKILMCPSHNVRLKKKRVMYGLPIPTMDYSDVILGGCDVDDSKPYGYECPVDGEVFYLDDDGKLYKENEDNEAESNNDTMI